MIDGGDRDGAGGESEGWDFFVSYTRVDQSWAEWIAWQLEAAGFRVLIQAWDFVAGSNWQIRMQQGIEGARRTVAVLSTAYLSSVYGQSEWQAAHAADPRGFARKLLPVRVEDCPRPGLLGGIVSIDLFDQDSDQASRYLLSHIGHAVAGRAKPGAAPEFPATRINKPTSEPTFPADQSKSPTSPTRQVERRIAAQVILERQRRVLGQDHPDTLVAASELVVALIALSESQEARTLAEDTLERQRRVLGPNDRATLTTAYLLARALLASDEEHKARSLAEDTLNRQRRTLGPDHPGPLATGDLLANALLLLHEDKEARELLDVEAANARGVQVGDRNTQINYFDGSVHPITHALAGTLRVRIRSSGAWFDVDGESVKVREVAGPCTFLGRSKDMDLCVQGPAAESVSRLHLIMRPWGRRWTVTDSGTVNKTSEMVPDSGEARLLPANVAIPVENGMRLRLGRQLWVGFEIEPAKFEGGVTPDLSDDPVRVRPYDLEEVALALLEPRRRDGAGARVPSVKELAGVLHCSPAEIRRRLRELRALAHVKALQRGPEHVAAALVRAFPYLQGLD